MTRTTAQHGGTFLRSLAALAVAMLFVSTARADRLRLFDGGEIVGEILRENHIVTIRTAEGVVDVRQQAISAIERDADGPSEPASPAPPDAGAETLFAMAAWASTQGLDEQAGQLHQRILALDADHAGVHRAMGQMHLNGRWLTAGQAAGLVAERIADGRVDRETEAILDELEAASTTAAQQQAIDVLRAHVMLQRGQFINAGVAFERAAAAADDDGRPRLAAIAELLAAHPDGTYRGADGAEPGSLAEPRMLTAALADLADLRCQAGAERLAEARRGDPDAADEAIDRAIEQFDLADALVPGVAERYRIEAARRRIALIRQRTEREAVRFDEELTALGVDDVTAEQYAKRLRRMLGYLESVGDDLDEVLALAEPWPRELMLDTQWARDDAARIERMRATLQQELDDPR